MNVEDQKRWMKQWRAAGPALEAVRVGELRELNEARRAEIVSSFFVLESHLRRNTITSGLVEQQEIFHRARKG
jgi:hypothetical protein